MKNGVLYSFITAMLFVTLEPVSKLIAGEINPYAITFWRFIIGALILLPMAVVSEKKNSIKRGLKSGLKDFAVMTLLGVLFICVSMTLLQVGIKAAESPALIAIVFSSNSIFTILFAVVLLNEKITANKAIALVLGVVGVIACADFSLGTNWWSLLLGVAAALSFSLYTVLSKKYTVNTSGAVQAFVVFVMGSVILGAILLVSGVKVLPAFDVRIISILGYLVFVTGVGYACYFMAIEKGGVIMGSLAFFIKPILTPFVTLFINGITPGIKEFFAVMCIVVASYFAAYKKQIK